MPPSSASKAKSSKKKHKKKDPSTFLSPLTSSVIPKEDGTQFQQEEQQHRQRRASKKKKKFRQSDDDEDVSTDEATHRRRREEKAKRVRREEEEADMEEARLTAMLFGGDGGGGGLGVLGEEEDGKEETRRRKKKKKKRKGKTKEKKVDDDDRNVKEGGGGAVDGLFELDRTGVQDEEEGGAAADKEGEEEPPPSGAAWPDDDDDDNEDDEDDDEDEIDDEEEETKPAPAWIDDDDMEVTASLLSTNRLRKLRKARDEINADALPGMEYQQRLRDRFVTTQGRLARTDWADVSSQIEKAKSKKQRQQPKKRGSSTGDDDGDTSSDSDDEERNDEYKAEKEELLSSTTPLLLENSSSALLPPNIINMERCPDANLSEERNDDAAAVQAVHFHPGSDAESPLMLTAGLDKTLRFFKVGTEKSEKVHGIFFPELPIYSASFLGDTGNVVVSGRRKFFYVYDAVVGKLDRIPQILGRYERSLERLTTSPDGRTLAFLGNDGYIILVDAKTKHWIADLKMNGTARAVTFTPDGEQIIASGSDGDVYRWDLRSTRCIDRFHNEDGTITSALSSSSKFLAVGAESGVVNLYNDHHIIPNSINSSSHHQLLLRQPVKSIMNIQTPTNCVKFNNPDGQILAMSSRFEMNCLKLLHVPTATVFQNWPTSKTPLGYVWSMDFSPGSKFLAVGNDKGKCLLYSINHYKD